MPFVIRADLCYSLLTSGLPQTRARRTLRLTNRNTPSRRVAREVLMLLEYNFEIRHIKGTSNGRADALSQ
jgi:pilus assembly protein TadC